MTASTAKSGPAGWYGASTVSPPVPLPSDTSRPGTDFHSVVPIQPAVPADQSAWYSTPGGSGLGAGVGDAGGDGDGCAVGGAVPGSVGVGRGTAVGPGVAATRSGTGARPRMLAGMTSATSRITSSATSAIQPNARTAVTTGP